VIAFRVLQAAGLNPDADVTRQGLGASESAGALKDGKVDAFFWSGGLPTAAVQDLAYSQGLTIRLVPTGDLVPALQRDHGPLYFPLTIPAGAYRGVTDPVSVVGVANVLVVNRSMAEQLAYDITRVLFEQQAALAAIHPEARNLSLETATKGSPADFHPGALRYFRERTPRMARITEPRITRMTPITPAATPRTSSPVGPALRAAGRLQLANTSARRLH
jgi:hypothetical protein